MPTKKKRRYITSIDDLALTNDLKKGQFETDVVEGGVREGLRLANRMISDLYSDLAKSKDRCSV